MVAQQYLTGRSWKERSILSRDGLKKIVLISSGLIRNQNRRSFMATINVDVHKILFHCGFNRISNSKHIDEDVFVLFEEIVSLTEKEIGNLSKVTP